MIGAVFGGLIIPDLNAVAVMEQDIDSAGHCGLLQWKLHPRLHLFYLLHVFCPLFYKLDQFVSGGLLNLLASIADYEGQKEDIWRINL